MTKAIIYLRKSTDREDKQKLSIDGQLQECQKIAAKNNLDVLEVIEDRQTAKEPGRPGFTEMMTKIGKGLASQVICWKSDRLARNPIDAGTIEWAVQNGNIQAIHSSDGVFRTGDNVLMLKMHFGMSTQFIIDLRKNVMRGMKQKLENGGVVQPAPFGYRNNRLDKTVEISEKNSKIVKELFHRRAKGWEFSELAKYSKERGFNFTPGRIESMLKNHFYYGMMKFA